MNGDGCHAAGVNAIAQTNGHVDALTPLTAVEPKPQVDIAPPAEPSPEFLSKIPHEFARRHLILSCGIDGAGAELLTIAPTTRPLAVHNAGVRLGRPVRTKVEEPETLAAAIDKAYSESRPPSATSSTGASATSGDLSFVAGFLPPSPTGGPAVTLEGSIDVERDLKDILAASEQDLLATSGKAPVVRLVDLLVFEALMRSASDVHIQPVRDKTLVRYRLDGSLHTVRELPGSLASAVVSRVKVMARMDVAEQRAPQDGRASVSIGSGGGGGGGGGGASSGRRVDLRISTLPNTFGERVVIRLLDPSRSPHMSSLAALGMPEKVNQEYVKQIAKTSGIVLSTGPTGSGKTTTLYATLAFITSTNSGASARGCELNMMTVEDPVEYDLSGSGLSISQTQVDSKKNLTFATGLRHILRQDPDVIMVGEIRDEETARIAVQASLTGHLVLSTLHTNDAASAIARLIDLDVEPFLVASSLSAVLAQRLVRRVHPPCTGQGCKECLNTGYKGRMGVFELLTLDSRIKQMVSDRRPAGDIKAAAEKAGMITLKAAGLKLVEQGVTTREELARVIEAVDEEEIL